MHTLYRDKQHCSYIQGVTTAECVLHIDYHIFLHHICFLTQSVDVGFEPRNTCKQIRSSTTEPGPNQNTL